MKPRLSLITAFFLALSTAALAAERGYFGFDLSIDGEGFFLNPTIKSAKVKGVAANSPAFKAGVTAGDFIVEIEGHAVPGAKAADLKPYLQREAGQSTHFVIKKASGETVSLVLTPEPKP